MNVSNGYGEDFLRTEWESNPRIALAVLYRRSEAKAVQEHTSPEPDRFDELLDKAEKWADQR